MILISLRELCFSQRSYLKNQRLLGCDIVSLLVRVIFKRHCQWLGFQSVTGRQLNRYGEIVECY